MPLFKFLIVLLSIAYLPFMAGSHGEGKKQPDLDQLVDNHLVNNLFPMEMLKEFAGSTSPIYSEEVQRTNK